MAYTKTQWVNNTTPINDTNLNKMEQGIYDNSLVVEAVTNTLNPTDTETYKTAELTEGQITDVIGVSDIVIKGQTSQDGEPTPSSPVDINVVSGSNVVNIKSKNLININKLTPGYVLGTGGFSTQSTNEEMYSEFIKVLPNTQYTFKIFETTWNGFNSSNWIGIGEYRDAQVNSFIQRDVMGTGTQKYYTITTTANTNYIVVSARGLASATKIQLEIGSTATDYTPHYQGKELPLDLGTIELCKIGNYQDYFYKFENDWYLHKETFKTIIPSSVNGVMQNSNKRFFVNKTQIGNYDIFNTSSPSQTFGLYCDILKEVTAGQTWSGTQGISYDYNASSGTVGFDFAINGLTTVAEYQEALAGKTIVAILNTPTNTEITNTTLISQLEAIYNAPLYEQTNITQTNNDLPMVLDITACKDNINGIKAFIRK